VKPLSLFNHMLWHTKPFACDLCDQKFSRQIRLDSHKRRHNDVKQIKTEFKCKQKGCEEVFENYAKFYNHSRIHLPEISCPFCRKLVKAYRFTDHKKMHTNPLTCSLCDEKFPRKKDLEAHKNRVHDKNMFKCDLCPKAFSNKVGIRCHIYEYHLDVETFPSLHKKFYRKQCTKCDKKCATSSDLKQHMAVHSDARAFKCDQCDYSGKTKNGLYMHMQRHSKPFKCSQCSEGYATRKGLNRHLKGDHGS
jgi:KRAB domain-containing zinc finger protein